MIFLLSILIILASKAIADEDRAGEWKGVAECGEFAFIVDTSGKRINRIEFTKLKELRNAYSLESKSGGWQIDNDGKFDITILKILNNITFHGNFNQESTRATGTWKMPSGCSSKWNATKAD